MLLENIRIDDHLDKNEVMSIQPRENEGCFAEVNENLAINVYLIQDQIPEWLLAFFDNDLNIAYRCIDGLPVLSLRFRHLQLTMPLYNNVPSSSILTLCSLDYPSLRVNQIKRYRLPDDFFQSIKQDIEAVANPSASAIYERFDSLDENETNFNLFEQGMTCQLQALQ